MFVILTIPTYAADTKKITSVSIQRIYKVKEDEINADQVSFKPSRSEYTITYQGMYDASDLPIGSYMDYRITLNAKKGYDFEWLKERNCLSDSGTIQGLSISADTHPVVLPYIPIRYHGFKSATAASLEWDSRRMGSC